MPFGVVCTHQYGIYMYLHTCVFASNDSLSFYCPLAALMRLYSSFSALSVNFLFIYIIVFAYINIIIIK